MKRTLRTAVIAGLAIVAVAIAAATFDSTLNQGAGSGGRGASDGSGGGMFPAPQSGPTPGETVPIPLFDELLTVLGMLSLLVLAIYLILYRREAIGTIVGVLLLVGLAYLAIQFLSPSTPLPRSEPMEPGNGSILGGGSGSDGDETPQPTTPSLWVLAIIGIGVVGAVVVLIRSFSTEEPDTAVEQTASESDAAAVGRAARRAADRIEESSDLNNEVYRAWQEMTDLLDVDNAATKTPGEFAEAAIEAGMEREDVTALTELFEDVRYGTLPPSGENERKAIAIFRRIEDRYVEDDE